MAFDSLDIPMRSQVNLTFTKVLKNLLVPFAGITLLAGFFAQPLYALEYECQSGPDKRFIRMELPGITHLCEVTVTYTTSERKVMWYANQDTQFCSAKTEELASKYQNQWGFECNEWPNHDGIDDLSDRNRTILDTELKALIDEGNAQSTPFLVEGVKAVTNDNNLLVLQFFLHEPSTGTTSDRTHIINDDGETHRLLSQLDSLATYVDADVDYVINSALISNVTDNGAMEIITVVDENTASEANSKSACYGNQILMQQSDGKLIARTPHRYVCPDKDDG